VSLYLDTSVIVALFTNDRFTAQADAFLRKNALLIEISDFAAAEFASAVARKVRMRELSRHEARNALSTFDRWVANAARRVFVTSADIAAADAIIRRLDLSLRAPDALNIALAHRLQGTLVTFDSGMAKNAQAVGVDALIPAS
jgi:predicted nucleic acid-binding protein